MTDRTDHAAEAGNALTIVSELGLANNEGYRKQELLAEAQAHATLALVEQQRIANLIAYVSQIDDTSASIPVVNEILTCLQIRNGEIQ